MKKRVKFALVILVILLMAFVYFLLSYDFFKEETLYEDSQVIIEEWIKAGGSVSDGVYEFEIGEYLINDDGKTVILYDENGNAIFFTPIDDLVNAIEIGELKLVVEGSLQVPSAAPPAPTPVTVPVPVPTPIPTLANQTNLSQPSPSPVPTPPNVTPTPGPYLPQCSNGQWDGDESDMDCGGSCAPCLSGSYYNACWENTDCATNNCVGTMFLPVLYKGVTYTDYNSIRILAGDTGIIQFQGICQ